MTTPTDHRTDDAGARRERLREEREFLLRSLDDLDAERAEGNIDEETYARLHADYTARAAAVLRRLDGQDEPGAAPSPQGAARRTGRGWLVGVGIAGFAVVVGIALAWGLGARLPGETITGDQGVSAAEQQARLLVDLRADVRRAPNDPQARLALGRALMGAQRARSALEAFREAARLDPTNPEPFAYSGWLVRLQGFPDQALTLLDKAIEVDPEYPDARFFKGIVLFRDRNDPDAAIVEFRKYLGSAPDSPLATQVRRLLAEAIEAERTGGADGSQPPTESSPTASSSPAASTPTP